MNLKMIQVNRTCELAHMAHIRPLIYPISFVQNSHHKYYDKHKYLLSYKNSPKYHAKQKNY